MTKFTAAILGSGALALVLAGESPRAAPQGTPASAPSTRATQSAAARTGEQASSGETSPKRAQAPVRQGGPAMVPAHAADSFPVESQNALVKQYCVTCHNDRALAGHISLATFDAAHAPDKADVAEKMIRKLRAGMMPPPGARRPEGAQLAALATALETRIDKAATLNPNPGWRPFQRLNRAEYSRSVRDLLDIDVDVTTFLPPDTVTNGFDNVADSQSLSPTLMEGYLRAAGKISNLAVGEKTAAPTEATYKVPRTTNQLRHVDGAPLGTRGGVSVIHHFPADGEYIFRTMLHSIPTGQLYGSTSRDEKIEFSINGERVALLDINPRMSEADAAGMNVRTAPIFVKAGPQRVSAAFLEKFDAPFDDLIAPIDYTIADSQIGSALGVTTFPHVRDFVISGPVKVMGVSDTPSRRKIFTCRPLSAAEEAPCANRIIARIAEQAYRRPVNAEDTKGLHLFYAQGRKDGGDFESGIRMALQAILASPHFIFRLETTPSTVRPGQNYRISNIDLASRLSYFLWASGPDDELLAAAKAGTLRTPVVLERQVRRMLADPRSEALATRFAAQWFRLQDLEKIDPDALLYPSYDHGLAEAMRRETELLFDSLVREDRSILDLLTADYTFVNERLARHYKIPNVNGSDFQRVPLTDVNRRGILGQGSVLMLTSVADRTSPVLRGKWVMEVLLGSPPPAPPANVPLLEETKTADAGKLLTVRERMEEHRKNPTCNSCHRVIDPLGLALENFDVTGAWRIRDSGNPVDPTGELYDGTKMEGPVGLRNALLKHKDMLLLSFTEHLMTYALGRRVEFYDMPTVRSMIREAGRNDHKISAFVLSVVKSSAFQMGKAQAETTTAGDR
jgi:mono/diheme cytochrome c family protein